MLVSEPDLDDTLNSPPPLSRSWSLLKDTEWFDVQLDFPGAGETRAIGSSDHSHSPSKDRKTDFSMQHWPFTEHTKNHNDPEEKK